MKIVNCMKTEEAAFEMLARYDYDEKITNGSHCQCECGQTQAVVAYHKKIEKVALVGVCDACGDDDAFPYEVINS